jgi:hypothetical protein
MAVAGLAADRLAITGCIQFDKAAPQNAALDRRQFCRKYGLREESKIVVLCPTPPAAHIDTCKEDYRRISAIVRETPGFDLIIKPHPRDFAGIKQGMYYTNATTPTWVQLAPGVPACVPADTFDCYRHAEVLITQNSSLFKEAALFHKPILDINVPESRAYAFATDIAELARHLPQKRFRPP